MAEGLFREALGDRFDVFSAGTRPSGVRAEAIAVMAEAGIDISGQRSKGADEFLGQEFRYVVTVCDNARESCPAFPASAERVHWSFEDPAAAAGTLEEREAAFRKVRDQIAERVKEFAAGTGAPRGGRIVNACEESRDDR
jgi:arsenate reductase